MLTFDQKEKIINQIKDGVIPVLYEDLSRFAEPDFVLTGQFDNKKVVCKTKNGATVFVQSYNTCGVRIGFNIYSADFIRRVCGVDIVDYIGAVMYRGDTFDILFSSFSYSGSILLKKSGDTYMILRKNIKDLTV